MPICAIYLLRVTKIMPESNGSSLLQPKDTPLTHVVGMGLSSEIILLKSDAFLDHLKTMSQQ